MSEGHGAGLFHIRGLRTGEIVATFDQILADNADLGIPFGSHMEGAELPLLLWHGNGV